MYFDVWCVCQLERWLFTAGLWISYYGVGQSHLYVSTINGPEEIFLNLDYPKHFGFAGFTSVNTFFMESFVYNFFFLCQLMRLSSQFIVAKSLWRWLHGNFFFVEQQEASQAKRSYLKPHLCNVSHAVQETTVLDCGGARQLGLTLSSDLGQDPRSHMPQKSILLPMQLNDSPHIYKTRLRQIVSRWVVKSLAWFSGCSVQCYAMYSRW